ncbi:DUF481 domain-containing protein, partial [bacterium]|nr:DUF481 domain-containing protein [bacterium]
KYLKILIILFTTSFMSAQERPKLFLDCRTNCDMRYFKSEINFVDFMLDRQSAELYILLVRQNTGSGGSEFIMTVENKKSSQPSYELKFFTDANAVDDDRRKEILKHLKQALLKYMVCEDLMIDINYSVEVSEDEKEEVTFGDPWNAWVFSLGVNGNLNRESQFNSQNFRFNVSANRTTDKHKFYSRINYNTNESNFTVGEGDEEETISNVQTSYYGNLLYVYSLTRHWSAGGVLRYSRSIFENYDHSITVSPAIEYNIFPYHESADHNFTFRYEVGMRYNDYIDSTSYFKTTEMLWRHRLSIDYQIVQPWGNIDVDAGVSQFLSLTDRYSIDINPSVNVNIFKGLNFYTGIYYGITKDRINIPKGDLSVEDILLQNKLRDSNFSLYMYFGISYRFGSASNNVVNTRF